MPDLIAQGSKPSDRWRRTLPADQTIVLGRRGDWAIAWDSQISRQHAELRFTKGKLQVRCLPHASNPIFLRGNATDFFDAAIGDHFVIGETTFSISDERADVSLKLPAPEVEETFHIDDLKKLRFRNADQRITLLSRLAELIATSTDDRDLFSNLSNLLLAGITRGTAVAFVAATDDEVIQNDEDDAGCPFEVLHWDRRRIAIGDFQPSERLIRGALRSQTAVLHVWKSATQTQFTADEGTDWAFCTPLPRTSARPCAIYVSGRFSTETDETSDIEDYGNPSDLRDDLKFTEVIAASLGNAMENRQLQQRQAGLRQFFAPVVLAALAHEDPDEVLAPREADVSVLFCDLRGFSRRSEQQADDLLELLDRVSQALGVTTQHVLANGGVVGDLQGDAVMGFWGWPLPQENTAALAARAALAIRAEFQSAAAVSDQALAGFQAGIGLATGRAVAGKIGTDEVVKVTVFGPVVNLAARLEGMTKILRAPILMDEPTAIHVRKQLSVDDARVRRLAVVRPYGLETPVDVSELLPSESEYPGLSNENIADYEQALASLVAGEWPAAFEHLHRVPADDLVKDFLTVLIAQHNRTAPTDWDGVIPLTSKS